MLFLARQFALHIAKFLTISNSYPSCWLCHFCPLKIVVKIEYSKTADRLWGSIRNYGGKVNQYSPSTETPMWFVSWKSTRISSRLDMTMVEFPKCDTTFSNTVSKPHVHAHLSFHGARCQRISYYCFNSKSINEANWVFHYSGPSCASDCGIGGRQEKRKLPVWNIHI